MMSRCVAALTKGREGAVRRRIKSSACAFVASFFACARSCGSSAWAEKPTAGRAKTEPLDGCIVRIVLNTLPTLAHLRCVPPMPPGCTLCSRNHSMRRYHAHPRWLHPITATTPALSGQTYTSPRGLCVHAARLTEWLGNPRLPLPAQFPPTRSACRSSLPNSWTQMIASGLDDCFGGSDITPALQRPPLIVQRPTAPETSPVSGSRDEHSNPHTQKTRSATTDSESQKEDR